MMYLENIVVLLHTWSQIFFASGVIEITFIVLYESLSMSVKLDP